MGNFHALPHTQHIQYTHSQAGNATPTHNRRTRSTQALTRNIFRCDFIGRHHHGHNASHTNVVFITDHFFFLRSQALCRSAHQHITTSNTGRDCDGAGKRQRWRRRKGRNPYRNLIIFLRPHYLRKPARIWHTHTQYICVTRILFMHARTHLFISRLYYLHIVSHIRATHPLWWNVERLYFMEYVGIYMLCCFDHGVQVIIVYYFCGSRLHRCCSILNLDNLYRLIEAGR